MYACFGGHNELIKFLKNYTSSDFGVPQALCLLRLAITGGDLETVKLIFDIKLLEAADPKGCTPLFYAVYFGKEQVADFLLSHGANLNAIDFQYQTPLIIAIKCGLESLVSLLLKSNTNLEMVTSYNETALSLALKTGNEKIMNMIQEHERKRDGYMTPKRAGLNPEAREFKSGCALPLETKSLNRPSFIRSSTSFLSSKIKKSLNLQINTYSPNSYSPSPSPTGIKKLDFESITDSTGVPHSPCLKQNVSVCKFGCSDLSPKIHDFIPTEKNIGTVKEFLKSLELEKYWHFFQNEEIDFETLFTLTEDDLKEIGITLMGPRKKLIFAIQQIQKKKMKKF